MTTARAIETTGVLDNPSLLKLDTPFPINQPVRVIILLPQDNDDDFDEAAWLASTSGNPAFDFLKDATEDIYTLTDGKPFHDEG
jgi:hypothetical protein